MGLGGAKQHSAGDTHALLAPSFIRVHRVPWGNRRITSSIKPAHVPTAGNQWSRSVSSNNAQAGHKVFCQTPATSQASWCDCGCFSSASQYKSLTPQPSQLTKYLNMAWRRSGCLINLAKAGKLYRCQDCVFAAGCCCHGSTDT